MKHFTLVLAVFMFLVAVIAVPASAAVNVVFTNGSTTSWETYVVKDGRYCTRLVFGEICYPKADVKSITRAGKADAGGEYGMSVIGDEYSAARGNDLSATLGKSEAEDRAFKAKRDADFEARQRAERRHEKSNKDHGKSEWAR